MAILGLRTVIYKVSDVQRAKQWYSTAFGVQPYFDQPFYVGFSVGGFELGLDPDTKSTKPGPGGSVAYWGVPNIDKGVEQFIRAGAVHQAPVRARGGGIRLAALARPFVDLTG